MQEQGNIDFVLNYELGHFCPTNERIIGAVRDLQDPQRYADTVHRLEGAVPRDGAAQIVQTIIEQLALVDASPATGGWRRPGLFGLRRRGRPSLRGRRERGA
jgi:hypothetical protein